MDYLYISSVIGLYIATAFMLWKAKHRVMALLVMLCLLSTAAVTLWGPMYGSNVSTWPAWFWAAWQLDRWAVLVCLGIISVMANALTIRSRGDGLQPRP